MPDREMPHDQATIAWVGNFVLERGYCPTLGEVAEWAGVTKTAVHRHVRRLRDEGRLSYVDGEQRTLRVAAAGRVSS